MNFKSFSQVLDLRVHGSNNCLYQLSDPGTDSISKLYITEITLSNIGSVKELIYYYSGYTKFKMFIDTEGHHLTSTNGGHFITAYRNYFSDGIDEVSKKMTIQYQSEREDNHY